MKAKINLKIWGVQGRSPSWNENRGACTIFIEEENNKEGNYICVDAFTGRGETYTRREENEIEIRQNEKIVFLGNFEQLCKKLNS